MSRKIHPDDVALHNTEGDAWVIIDGAVYDVSEFLSQHPVRPQSSPQTNPFVCVFALSVSLSLSIRCRCLLLHAPVAQGGKRVLLKACGKDGTKQFNMFHDADAVMREHGDKMKIGVVDASAPRGGGGLTSSGAAASRPEFVFGDWTPPEGSRPVRSRL